MSTKLIKSTAKSLLKLGLVSAITGSILVVSNREALSVDNNRNANVAPAISRSKLLTRSIVSADFGQQFELKLNQSASINSGEVKVNFLRVIEDSRCPADVDCVWSGQIQVAVNVSVKGSAPKTLSLINRAGNKNISTKKFKKYSIEFVKAEPYPKNRNQKTKPADQIIFLIVSRVTNN
jgi:hypothetical protein